MAIACVKDYNAKEKPSLKESPDMRYQRSEQPKCYPVDEFTRMALFCKQSEHKVIHGQITIKRGMHTYEYQLPAACSTRYNGKTVGVRYAGFDEIFVYDLQTDEPVCSIPQKPCIHGAQADHDNRDMTNLYKNGSRKKAVDSRESKRKAGIYSAMDTVNPDAIDTVNRVKAPKDIVKRLSQDAKLKEMAIEQGISPEMVFPLPAINMTDIQRPAGKETKSPFMPSGKVEMKKIILED